MGRTDHHDALMTARAEADGEVANVRLGAAKGRASGDELNDFHDVVRGEEEC